MASLKDKQYYKLKTALLMQL